MKRRETEIFNLSFLDVLSGALGAVLFLFIVVPKGGKSASAEPQLNLSYDTVEMKFFGEIPDSMLYADIGDSLLAVIINYEEMPNEAKRVASLSDQLRQARSENRSLTRELKRYQSENQSLRRKTGSTTTAHTRATTYKGDLPSVPCKLSVEVKWEDIEDNIDLFVCKDGSCVYGRASNRRNPNIGFWDSGKSKTSLFGGDLRTTQEAVRQFDAIIPGEYNIYAQYKGSDTPKSEVLVAGLVYTKADNGKEQGETFTFTLPYNEKERELIGKLSVNADGSFKFNRQ